MIPLEPIKSLLHERLKLYAISISYQNAERTGTYAVLVTNRVDWSATRIIATYLVR